MDFYESIDIENMITSVTIPSLTKWLRSFLCAIILAWAGWISNSVISVYHLPEKVDTIQTDVDTIQNILAVPLRTAVSGDEVLEFP